MPRRRDRGFTLIEVLLAFTILTLALAAVFRSVSSGLEQERIAAAAMARVIEARSLVERVGTEIPLADDRLSGRLSTGEEWVLEMAEQALPGGVRPIPGAPRAYSVRLTVEGRDGRGLSFTTVRLGP